MSPQNSLGGITKPPSVTVFGDRVFKDIFSAKKGDFIEALGTGLLGRKSCIGVFKSDWLSTMELGEVEAKERPPEGLSYDRVDSEDTRDLAIVKLRLFSL